MVLFVAVVCLAAGIGAAFHWQGRGINAWAAWLGCSAILFVLWGPWVLVWAARREKRNAAPAYALVLLLCVVPPLVAGIPVAILLREFIAQTLLGTFLSAFGYSSVLIILFYAVWWRLDRLRKPENT